MTYDTVATFSQVSSMLLFIALFLGILVYVLLPSTGKKLERAQRQALDLDDKQKFTKGRRVS